MLFWMLEEKVLVLGLIEKNINLPKFAFLGSRDLLIEGSGTNCYKDRN